MIMDLGPTRRVTRIGVSPDKIWFQGSSRGAETTNVYSDPTSFAPEIADLRHIRLAYTNNNWGLHGIFFQSYGPGSAVDNP